MTLQECLGSKLYDDIRSKAILETAEFVNKSGATKLALVDKIKLENSIMKQGVEHLVNVIDDVAAENEFLEKKNKYYVQTYGEIDNEYLNKHELIVTKTTDKRHAKIALAKYIQKYETENNNAEQQKVKPMQEVRISKK